MIDHYAEARARRAKALTLRREGNTFAQVAGVLGVSEGRARQIVARAERDERNLKEALERRPGLYG